MGMAQRNKRTINKNMQRIYRRRRIAAVLILILALAVVAGVGYGIGDGVRHLSGAGQTQSSAESASADHSKKGDSSASSKSKQANKTTAGVPDCTADDVELRLSTDTSTTYVGGSITFKVTIAHNGSTNCLIDAANDSRVLTITSGKETIWRSDSCPADSRLLLMTDKDEDSQTITWNTNRSGSKCADDDSLPRVNAGTYVGRLSLKDHDQVQSDPLSVVVQ